LVLTFKIHAKKHYRKNDVETSEVDCFNLATQPLLDLYGFTGVDDFGPLALKAVRAAMVGKRWARKSINRAVGRIRHVFRWGVENELVNPATLLKLQAVSPLLAGRTEAHDNAPRTGVPEADIEAVRQDVSPLVRDLIDLQRLIGARSGELLGLTTGCIDRNGPVWIAKLIDHKNIHHSQVRILAIGPKAQPILTKYLSADSAKPIFSMLRTAYCRAVTRACERLKIQRWVPHQLRHTAAETVRSMFGLEHCQSVLGHAKADMSEHYAKVALCKAVEVALKIG
jgi:integrase